MFGNLPKDLSRVQDRALLLVGFLGALRPSQLGATRVEHLGPPGDDRGGCQRRRAAGLPAGAGGCGRALLGTLAASRLRHLRVPEGLFGRSKTFRSELLGEMQKTLRLAASMPDTAWDDVAWEVRDSARREGRTLERRLVSRTLLIKGLEFDHAIVLNADELDEKNLYVAMTRGSRTLTLLTAT